MQGSLLKQIQIKLRNQARHRKWLSIVLCLAVVVAIGTTAVLSISGIAMTHREKVLDCKYQAPTGGDWVGYAAHIHNADCYDADGELLCPLQEVVPHVHDASCYTTERELVCTEDTTGHQHSESCRQQVRGELICDRESDPHEHTADCYELVRGELICTDDSEEHEHTDDCYQMREELTCTRESDPHVHDDSCYEWTEELTCGLTEGEGAHVHTDACYVDRKTLTCGKQAVHEHDASCFDENGELICGQKQMPLHVHGEECFLIVELSDEEVAERARRKKQEESDPGADLESAGYWEYFFSNMELSGDWSRDLVAVAQSQLGYRESERNYEVQEDGSLKGYTRYGAWYGLPYGDWCAMFVSFCLRYADIPETAVPWECGTRPWVEKLRERNLYADAEGYLPKAGDIVFFDWERDGLTDHVGLVSAVDAESGTLQTIEGNHTPAVERFEYSLYDSTLSGYGVLPENPGKNAPAGGEDDSGRTVVLQDETGTQDPDETWIAADFTGTAGEVTVTVHADAGTFPPGTTMNVSIVDTADVEQAVSNAVSGEVVRMQALDITFCDQNGREIEPKLPVRVSMSAARISEAEQPVVVHVPEEGEAAVMEPSDDAAEDELTFETDAFSVYVLAYTVDFEYEVDGKVFSYSIPGETSITLDALLCELTIVNNENVKGFLNAIESVVFSNPELVKVTEVLTETPVYAIEDKIFDLDVYTGSSRDVNQTVVAGRNWILTSVAPFTSEESLTIRLLDGQQTTIKVTDSQACGDLAAFVSDAVLEIDGKTYGAGTTWNVRPDVDYSLTLNFLEKGSRQLPGGGQEITMAMPSGLSLEPGAHGSFDIPCGMAGTLIGNTWWVDDSRTLHVRFAEDPDDLLTRSSNIHFDLTLEAKFDGSETHFEFNNNVQRDASFDTTTDVDVQKTGSYNASTGKMEYTVTVKSSGKSQDVTVSDVISGNMLTLDESSFEITPSGKTPSSQSADSHGFSMTFGELAHNETVTIKYTASVDTSKLGPGGTVTGDNGKNSVTVTNKDGKTDTDENITNTIKFSDIAKSSTSSTEIPGGEKVEMEWKITANEGCKGSLVGSKITDQIDWGSKDIMKYASNPLTLNVVVKDKNGNVVATRTDTVAVTDPNNQGQEGWTYTIPGVNPDVDDNLENYSYEITYKTIVTKQTENTTVKNNAGNESDGGTSGTGVVPGTNPGGGGSGTDIVGGKAAVAVTPEYIDWDIVVAIQSSDDFTAKFEIVDEIPNGASLGRKFADTFDSILSVTGLHEDHEDYTYAVTKESHDTLSPKQKDILTITFWQDKEHNNPGLDNGARTITVRIRTRNDPDWVNFADTAAGGEQAIYHTNSAKVNDSKPFTDKAAPLHTQIDKEKEANLSAETVDGVQLPRYEYSVTLTNVTELPVVITDTYDPDELIFIGEGQATGWLGHHGIAASSQKNNLNNPDSNYHATFSADDTTGTLTITANSLPTKPDGSYYEFYRIYYTMRVKDADALDSFAQQAIANGGTYLIGNTAAWNGDDDHVDVEYKVPGLSKEGYFSSTSNNRQYTFILDVNRNGLTMNAGANMDLLDTHTKNLSVDYSTVKVYKITDGQSYDDAKQYQLNDSMLTDEVIWNFDANEGTFSVPDRTHYVIKYDALVIGSGNQEFRNEAELKGYKSSKQDSRNYGSDSHAGGNINQINLLKYEEGQTSKGLQGAVFQLFKGTGEYDPVTGDEIKEELKYGKSGTRPDGTTFAAGDNITFTTGSDGTVLIALDQTRHGEQLDTGVHYFLKEINSPPGYQIDSSVEYWEFTLTDDPDEVNYGDPDRRDERGRRQWIYFSYGDILKMGNTSTVEPLNVVVNKQWFDEDGNEITGENLNQEFKAKIQLMRKTDSGDYVKVKVTGSGSDLMVTEVTDTSGEEELNSDNNWAYTWSQLPRVKYDGEKGMEIVARYAYKVEEISVEGYVASVSETENETTKTYALKNYKVPENRTTEITVNKMWQDSEGNVIPGTTERLPDSIRFSIYQVTSKTPFTRVPSSGGNKYIISGDSHLLNGDDDTSDNYGIYQISESQNWTATFSSLPSVVTVGGETTYYAYYVKEEALAGYTTTYTSDGTTRTIVNREPLDEHSTYIDIGLEKKWTDGASTVPPEGASATFTVHQQKSTKSGVEPTGSIAVKVAGTIVLRCNAGDTIVIKTTGNIGNGYNLVVNNQYVGWKTSAENSYKIDESFAGDEIEVRIADNSAVAVESITLAGSSPISYSDFVDTTWTKSVTLPTTAGAWSTVINNLLQEDADGNLYRYYITEDSCTPEASSTVFKDDIGKGTEHAINTAGQNVEVTNTYVQTTDFEFSKIWKDLGSQPTTWPEGKTITVTLNAYTGTNKNEKAVENVTVTLSATGSAADVTPAWSATSKPDGTVTTFKVEGLPKYKDGKELHYYVTETQVSGYRAPSYSTADGDILVFTGSDIPKATNGQQVINTPEGGYELPNTGGPGTRHLYFLGVMLVLLAAGAAAGLSAGKRRKKKAGDAAG